MLTGSFSTCHFLDEDLFMAADLISDSAEIKIWCLCHTGTYINTKEKESELDISKHAQRL